jgi:hypothetical protein
MQLERPYIQTVREGKRILQRYEQRQRRLEQLYHSPPISKSDSAEQERTKKIPYPLKRWCIVDT